MEPADASATAQVIFRAEAGTFILLLYQRLPLRGCPETSQPRC
jgi:hypothetical protein